MARIAIEQALTPIQEYLSQRGYQVEVLDSSKIQNESQSNYSAVVISGSDENVMGIQQIAQNCPVINAEGLTPEEVYERLQRLPQ